MATPRRKAFTLIEVMIVVVVLAIVAGTIIPQFQNSTKNAKSADQTKFNLRMLREQLQIYANEHEGRKPTTLTALTLQTNSTAQRARPPRFPTGRM